MKRDAQDARAVHAVAHVLELTNRIDDGVDWLTSTAPCWSSDNFFAVHNWWHLAPYHCDRLQWNQVPRLYDERVRDTDSGAILDMLDASALLWRLKLHGVDVSNRWRRLAELWEPRLEDAWYAFHDSHAMVAFAGAGCDDLARALLAVMERTAQQSGDNAAMTRSVGLPLARALQAYARSDYARVVELLGPIKAIAARAGQNALALALLNERLMLKPGSGLNRTWLARLGQMTRNRL